MATSNEGFETTIAATSDLSGSQYKAIGVGGAVATSTDGAVGILLNKPESGEHATACYAGESKYFANEAITAGNAIGVGAGGGFVVVSSTDTDAAAGVAKSTVTSGSTGTGYFGFSNAVAPTNVSMPVTAAATVAQSGLGYDLSDNKVADGVGCAGIVQSAIVSGEDGRIVISGICEGTVGAADAAAGAWLKCSTSGFLEAATTGTVANAMTLEAITSGSTGMVFAIPSAVLMA